MTDVQERFDHWLDNVTDEEAALLREQAQDIEELNDAFYRELSFGTAGLRGVIGLGPNRMNVYTVAKATQGLADHLNAHFDSPSVALARDSRNKGWDFVRAAACTLAANGIVAHVYEAIQPTPVLSFTVRHLGCSAGINITASHNPAAYNGYKAYGADGCQIASDAAVEIQRTIDDLDFFDDVKTMDFDEALAQGLVKWVDASVIDAFLDEVEAQSVEPRDADAPKDVRIVYTPLNGTGLECVTRILARVGIDDVTVVDEQREPDGDFTTCPYPNPEDRAALEVGLGLCEKVNPDLLLATDPDADRVGIAVLHDGAYQLLTGNEVGVLLVDYIARRRKERGEDLDDKLVVTTIVSTLMPDAQARYYGFELRRVLTGFKYIGGQIARLGADHADEFMFGFEESYGYMSGTYVRDKDAISASMLICQMAQMYKNEGMDLVEAMEQLYERYGYYLNQTINMGYPGSSGAQKMAAIMDDLRSNPPQEIAGMKVESILDYSESIPMTKINGDGSDEQTLPAANVVSLVLGDGVQIMIRPSGTEPKIKAYVFSKAAMRDQAEQLLGELAEAARALLGA